jgi:hypothetical protein
LSRYRGVYWRVDPSCRDGGLWHTQISTDGKRKTIKCSTTETVCAMAYDEFIKGHGILRITNEMEYGEYWK